ncbi:hypothetical protein HPB50_019650 [Hyalomma asiaticum]|uniref:Uncharacterized protein n=1 Tax=Hyalomma asiaticum TaxID=266040 RepID=A0ACB7SGP0_HYAAI|nr:hypothetical protein HPB50_019650 [Hyalomma asiaticum]
MRRCAKPHTKRSPVLHLDQPITTITDMRGTAPTTFTGVSRALASDRTDRRAAVILSGIFACQGQNTAAALQFISFAYYEVAGANGLPATMLAIRGRFTDLL